MTVVTLRPDSTVSTTGVSLTGNDTIHGALSDNTDASYIYNVLSNDTVVVGLGDFTLPAGAVVKRVALRVRVANFDDD